MRQAKMNRKTRETEIEVSMNLDGQGQAEINTGIGFLDHMLVLFAAHSGTDIAVQANGDLQIDSHHTIEDIGITMGQVIARAMGDKRGIKRYGHAVLPMDEALVAVTLDISGRPFLVFQAEFATALAGDCETQMIEEFFRALAGNAGITLHINLLYGKNDHHKIEAIFKAFARSFAAAVTIDPGQKDKIPSTKGAL